MSQKMSFADIDIEEEDMDYTYDSSYDPYDSLDCEDPQFMTDRPSRFVKRHILPGLHPLIEEMRASNGVAKKGETLRCPMCGKTFEKRSYQQKFCSNDCKVRYHNKRQVWY